MNILNHFQPLFGHFLGQFFVHWPAKRLLVDWMDWVWIGIINIHTNWTLTMVHNHSIVGSMVHNHRKPSLPMVVLPQNHRKTINPNGCPQPFHSMVMVTLKTIESLRW